jgi:hypothetical protein
MKHNSLTTATLFPISNALPQVKLTAMNLKLQEKSHIRLSRRDVFYFLVNIPKFPNASAPLFLAIQKLANPLFVRPMNFANAFCIAATVR